MAWRASGVVEQRKRFVQEYESGEWTMAELCRIYEVSRESGYKWLKRSQVEGEAGLEDRSRAPVRHPNQTEPSIEQQLLALRQRHATWGARKLRAYLQQKQPRLVLPAASTIGALLKREGLTVPQAAASQDSAVHATISAGGRTESAVVCRFQGMVSDVGPSAHRSV